MIATPTPKISPIKYILVARLHSVGKHSSLAASLVSGALSLGCLTELSAVLYQLSELMGHGVPSVHVCTVRVFVFLYA